ncbi:MAG TPA: hypothetical protein VIX82_08670 [Solirubrobacteraceae bacterium]
MTRKPLFWRVFDEAEEVVAPRLEHAMRGDVFLAALGFTARARAGGRREIERCSRRLWHLVNLPAGSDVIRLRRELAELDRELRHMRIALDQALAERRREEGEDGDRPAQHGRPARPRSAGPRAKRAPRS